MITLAKPGYSPGRMLEELFKDLGEIGNVGPKDKHSYFIANNEGEVEVLVELPGCLKENVNVNSENNVLSIEATRNIVGSDEKISKQFQIGDELDVTSITCSLRFGILTVKIPKKEEVLPKQIEVKVD